MVNKKCPLCKKNIIPIWEALSLIWITFMFWKFCKYVMFDIMIRFISSFCRYFEFVWSLWYSSWAPDNYCLSIAYSLECLLDFFQLLLFFREAESENWVARLILSVSIHFKLAFTSWDSYFLYRPGSPCVMCK